MKSKTSKISIMREKRRRIRTRKGIGITKPRLSVYRSGCYIYAQIIDDGKARTLLAAEEKDLKKDDLLKNKLTKTQKAFLVGELLAKKALKKGVKEVVFDRGGYLFHGRVKALAEGARKGGLNF